MSVWFDPDRNKWRFHFQLNGRRKTGYCVDPRTGEAATSKAGADRAERAARAVLEQEFNDRSTPVTTAEYTLGEAFVPYCAKKEGKANWENERGYVAEILQHFGPNRPLTEINDTKIWEYIGWARKQPIMIYVCGKKSRAQMAARSGRKLFRPIKSGRRRTNSTINRYLNALREALRMAHETRDPTGRRLLRYRPNVPDLDEPAHLPRPIPDAVLQDILAVAPPHLADGAELARNLSMRKAEVFALTIDQVDTENRGIWLAAEKTKADRAEFIHANGAAMALLERLIAQARVRKTKFLLTYQHGKNGKWQQVKDPKRAWKTAQRRAGVEAPYKFHQIKAAHVSQVAMKSGSRAAQKAGRHANASTTERYILVADEFMRDAMAAIEFRRAAPDTTRTRDPHTAEADEGPTIAKLLKNLVGATGFEPATPRPPV